MVPDLSRIGTEPADQAAQATGQASTAAAGGAVRRQPGLVDGLHAQPTGQRTQHPAVQRDRRLQPQDSDYLQRFAIDRMWTYNHDRPTMALVDLRQSNGWPRPLGFYF